MQEPLELIDVLEEIAVRIHQCDILRDVLLPALKFPIKGLSKECYNLERSSNVLDAGGEDLVLNCVEVVLDRLNELLKRMVLKIFALRFRSSEATL